MDGALRLIRSMYQKLYAHYYLYKAASQNKKFILLNYVFWVLFYRRFLCYLVAVPLVAIYFCFYPFIKFRFIKLIGSAIGHYATTTELLLCELDKIRNDQFINIFYMEHSLLEPSISNMQLHKMWGRILFILPLQFTGVAMALDKMLMIFLKDRDYGMRGLKLRYDYRWARDVDGYFKEFPPHLAFTQEEHELTEKIMRKVGIKPQDRYVCLLIRSSAYNKGHPTWNVPERNADTATYLKACNFLAEHGYYVLRMGKAVDSLLPSDRHPKIIDYATSAIRSDFMDIYLSANCYFFISTGSGLDEIPTIFRRPVVYTNMLTAIATATWYPHLLFITKKLFYKNSGKLLSLKEQADVFLTYTRTRKSIHLTNFMKQNDLSYFDNTEDEILEVVKEMEARVRGEWVETESDKALQAKFWSEFPVDEKTFNPCEKTSNIPLYGKITVKIGARFLETYQGLL